MSVQSTAVPRNVRGTRLAGFLRGKRGRQLLNIGCLPAIIVVTLALLVVMNAVTFFQAPSWVTDKQTYLAAGRLILSMGTLAGVQLLATWIVGLTAGLLGLRAAVGQGRLIGSRLEVIRRRIAVAGWAVVVIRLIMVGVAIIGGINLYTSIFGFRLVWGFADDFLSFVNSYWGVFWVLAMVCLTQWLVGPLLRLRYSLALGALAGALTQNRDYRPWLALSLRLGMGLAGMLALLWGVAGLRLLASIVFDPVGYPSLPHYPDLFPLLPPVAASIALSMIIVTAILVIHTALQIFLTRMAMALARARLARPKRLGYYASTDLSFRKLAKTSTQQVVD